MMEEDKKKVLKLFEQQLWSGFAHGTDMLEACLQVFHGRRFVDSYEADQLLRELEQAGKIRSLGYRPTDPKTHRFIQTGLGKGDLSKYPHAHGWAPVR